MAGRVLIIEDEAATGNMLRDLLVDAGFDVLGPLMTLDEGLQAAESEDFGAAILDANLNGRSAGPVGERLVERGIPFVVVSGYGREHLPLAFKDALLLCKPFDHKVLLAVVRQICEVEILNG